MSTNNTINPPSELDPDDLQGHFRKHVANFAEQARRKLGEVDVTSWRKKFRNPQVFAGLPGGGQSPSGEMDALTRPPWSVPTAGGLQRRLRANLRFFAGNYAFIFISFSVWTLLANPSIVFWLLLAGVLVVTGFAVTDFAQQEGSQENFGFGSAIDTSTSERGGARGAVVRIGSTVIPASVFRITMFSLAAFILIFAVGSTMLWLIGLSATVVLCHAAFRDAGREQLEERQLELQERGRDNSSAMMA